MPCLLAVIALMAPRITIALLYFFSNFFGGVFATPLWPILGFLFLPTTLLWFVAVQHWFAGDWNGGIQIIGIILALMTDVSPAGGRRKRG